MRSKQKLPFIDKVFLWINCGLCLALLISYLAPITDPRKFWPVAFFGLAYPLLLLSNIIMMVYWALRKKWLVLISVLGILCGITVLEDNIGMHPGNSNVVKPQDPNAIRMMTYNVHDFKKFGSGKDISTKHEILEIIAGKQPDVIGIQEFYARKRGQYAMIDSVSKIIGSDNYYFENFSGSDEEKSGMAIFSKYPIVSKGLIQLSGMNNGNQCLYADINKNGRIFRVYSMHLQSINFEPEDYRYLDTVAKKGKPDLSSTRRLGSKLKKAFIKRSEQVAKIRSHASQCPYPYIISGDFNDTPSSFAVNQMAKGLKNTFCEKGFGLGRTYNGDFPNYQIDYIMATPGFDVTSYTIIERKLSDHYPVCADLLLK
ncbi:endonuclease/exonuclease/phosphatase family protein [Mucilaginibacter sp. UR6-11]|uniref:endonuclease/exonuclease/phosphatase family protein n=1 Tax=Mucilaginibacter sp. UR6-11 TaxID=1435644 RepID=UPI001E362815|nr:endonuclease/exonuclease/phosphatase family protein [Mucilaginibacter sp. UR6-11]MCC8424781.1 endonuclease/exonuclease/phosphatase family protein [Mucilaginibacter sp. UR6-11]